MTAAAHPSPRDRFLETLRASLDGQTFVKLTLSQPRNAEPELRNIYGRLVDLKEGRKFSFLYRYARRDITRNLDLAPALEQIRELLGRQWVRAHLFTTSGDWQLRCDKRFDGELKRSKATFVDSTPTEHNRPKVQPLNVPHARFLQLLEVTNAAGEARPGMSDKLRQIQRFVELLGHLLEASPLKGRQELRLVDMGAGKGYLTFAAAEYFRQRGISAEILGVEIRKDLVDLTNRVARESGFDRLRFVQGAIGEWKAPWTMDALVALHACNTATDDAIFQGIEAEASLILAAPCCHQEVRAQLRPPARLHEILRHGILAERQAEILTDGIRALLLEIHGYKASVFEFISPEHTGKNLMISATRRASRPDVGPLRADLARILEENGIQEQRLARLLGEL